MKWLEKKKSSLLVQTRQGESHPFGMLGNYVPLQTGEIRLYRSIREALPILDAAITKLVRLSGGVKVTAPEGQEELEEFLCSVNVGRGQVGLQNFLDAYLDSMLVCGQGVGEMVLNWETGEIEGLLCADPALLEWKEGASPLDFTICARREDGRVEELPRQDLLLFTPFQPEPGSPRGVSLLRSMPFLTGILLKIYQTIGANWERLGNARFAVTYKPNGTEAPWARERGEEIAREWSAAMRAGKNGMVRDFVAVGDVDIKVIGADDQVLDSQVPVRQILEQLVAKTGIPPFLLGLSWSSTERMSAQQADVMTSEITALRRMLTPVVERIANTWLRLHGYPAKARAVWEDINLQDLVEEAKAEWYHEQAEDLRQARETAETGS